jgi:hypothetical protein
MGTKLQVSNPGLAQMKVIALERVQDLPASGQEAIKLLSRLVEITKRPDFFLQMSPFLEDVKDFLGKMND